VGLENYDEGAKFSEAGWFGNFWVIRGFAWKSQPCRLAEASPEIPLRLSGQGRKFVFLAMEDQEEWIKCM
jgi:hypothetical protein